MPAAVDRPWRFVLATVALALTSASEVRAADPTPGPPLTIRRVSGPITVDGDLSDPGWQGVEGITTWYETRVGDNVEPPMKNVAYLAYDDEYLYAGFVFDDPDPKSIRAPIGDHDNISGAIDYGGLIVDSKNDGKTAQMFLATPRGVQYDALTSDVSGEDSAPDFYWDSQGKITESGWNLEIRVPFSTLRYERGAEPTWGMLLYRNYPRDRRYQFFSARLPRDVNCFVCNSSKMTGLANLPRGSHLVVAPFVTAAQSVATEAGPGTDLQGFGDQKVRDDYGVDVKWSPSASLTIDGTINPDFSQVESDAAQIVANERFALFFSEKRPFFLEGVDLLSTPMNAVYTRTITQPRTGLRATGRVGSTAYTVLGTQDEGGGLVILPGPQGSDCAFQDFTSDVGVVRIKRDFGQSYASVLATGRDVRHGGGSNLVVGPDFQWRPKPTETITAQILFSETETPERPDLHAEWDGRSLSDHAAQLSWGHSTGKHDLYLQFQDFGPSFRAWNGFMPQVGYREGYFEGGLTFRPKDHFLNRLRLFTVNWVDLDRDDEVLTQRNSIGAGMDGGFNSFIRIELNRDAFRVGDALLQRLRPRLYVETSPVRMFTNLFVDALVGQEVDFANGREGSGVSLTGGGTVRPNDHLELRLDGGVRWLDVDEPGASGRLFTAQVERLRATWSFNSRTFVRAIGQYEQTTRDPALYTFATSERGARCGGSVLFAYKLNWQTVFYAGFADAREYHAPTDQLEPNAQGWFTKISYAWQP